MYHLKKRDNFGFLERNGRRHYFVPPRLAALYHADALVHVIMAHPQAGKLPVVDAMITMPAVNALGLNPKVLVPDAVELEVPSDVLEARAELERLSAGMPYWEAYKYQARIIRDAIKKHAPDTYHQLSSYLPKTESSGSMYHASTEAYGTPAEPILKAFGFWDDKGARRGGAPLVPALAKRLRWTRLQEDYAKARVDIHGRWGDNPPKIGNTFENTGVCFCAVQGGTEFEAAIVLYPLKGGVVKIYKNEAKRSGKLRLRTFSVDWETP